MKKLLNTLYVMSKMDIWTDGETIVIYDGEKSW